jgi:hypothetical protein
MNSGSCQNDNKINPEGLLYSILLIFLCSFNFLSYICFMCSSTLAILFFNGDNNVYNVCLKIIWLGFFSI